MNDAPLKFCRDCEYFDDGEQLARCKHPQATSKPDLVTGLTYQMFCKDMREGACCYYGRLFELKYVRPKVRPPAFFKPTLTRRQRVVAWLKRLFRRNRD
jgi:hypothetical protein